MNNVIGYQDGSSITREACAWIAQLDGDAAPSPEDMAALREWMSRSPAHREEITRLAELWSRLHLLTELAAAAPAGRAAHARHGRRPMIRFALAAAAVVTLAVGGLLWRQALAPADPGSSYRTGVGEQRRVVLADGSTLLLNTASTAVVAFGPHERRVRLDRGEAHFEVERDAARPFVVEAGDGLVRAVGTAFSVRRQGLGAEVSVTEGRVELSVATEAPTADAAPRAAAAERMLLSAGQQVRFDSRVEAVADVPAEELQRKLAWRQGLLVFAGDRLDHVIAEVNRYTRQNIEFDDPALGELRIGGQFRIGETEALFRALEEGFDVRVRRDGQRVVLSSAGSPAYR